MSPHQIKNLKIDSVDSVDKGAGKDCDVLIRKRHAERNEAMETVAIKKAFADGNFHRAMSDTIALRKRHEISAGAFNEIYKHAAVTAYPLAKSEAEVMELWRHNPGGSKMFAAGLEADFEDMQRSTAAVNRSLVEKSKKPAAHLEDPDDRESDDDPDAELEKLARGYMAAHPTAQFTLARAITHVAEHDPDGRELMAQSKRRQMAKLYGEKSASVFDFNKAQSAVARTPPLSPPAVRRDPANRGELDRGQTAVDAGHQDGRDFDARVKRLMNEEGISRDEAITRLYREERVQKLGW